MKKLAVTCSKEMLMENINYVSRMASSRTTLPILECILLIADEDSGISLIANDLEMGIVTAMIPSDVETGGTVALDAKLFADIVRRLPDDAVYIEADENNITRIYSGRTEFTILGLNGEEFPQLPQVDKNQAYEISASLFKNMIRQTIFSVSMDDTKPILTGQLMSIQNNTMDLVAVDGFRVSYVKHELEGKNANTSVVVPAKTLHEISRIIPTDSDENLCIYVTERHAMFEMKKFTMVSRLLEGDFIKYNQVLNSDYTTKVLANRQLLLSSLERASLISKESKKEPVKLSLHKDMLSIDSKTQMGSFTDEIAVDIDGNDLEIAFNPKYWIDVLKVIEDDEVTMIFTTALSPCIIQPVAEGNYKYLILPLRLK
ncbi:MAG: DNA polymerase III subunit beta [Firmicutes bacterium]|nr:DNA polymerase III subunit beta [Bacillota bacterium]